MNIPIIIGISLLILLTGCANSSFQDCYTTCIKIGTDETPMYKKPQCTMWDTLCSTTLPKDVRTELKTYCWKTCNGKNVSLCPDNIPEDKCNWGWYKDQDEDKTEELVSCRGTSDCLRNPELEGCSKLDCNTCCNNVCTLMGCLSEDQINKIANKIADIPITQTLEIK